MIPESLRCAEAVERAVAKHAERIDGCPLERYANAREGLRTGMASVIGHLACPTCGRQLNHKRGKR